MDAPNHREASEVIDALADARAGDADASARLTTLVYARLRGMARSYFRSPSAGHTLQPTALVHEAFARLVERPSSSWQNRAHFLAVCATTMRGILTDYARRRRAAKRGGEQRRVTLSDVEGASDSSLDLLALDAALAELATRNERQARVVEFRFFSGMTVDETAQALGVSRTTVESDWRIARAWLSVRLAEDDA